MLTLPPNVEFPEVAFPLALSGLKVAGIARPLNATLTVDADERLLLCEVPLHVTDPAPMLDELAGVAAHPLGSCYLKGCFGWRRNISRLLTSPRPLD